MDSRPEHTLQVQDDFSGTPLSTLAGLGLAIYALISDFLGRCPVCDGRNCPVRHGLYYRQVQDSDGSLYEAFPIPRFRCRRRGPRTPEAVTFSVLPAQLVSRRRCSLPLMLWILELFLVADQSMDTVLDRLAERFAGSSRPWFPDPLVVYRLVHLFSQVYARLRSFPVAEMGLEPGLSGLRAPACCVVRGLTGPAGASPVVLAFHRRYFPNLLFDLRRPR